MEQQEQQETVESGPSEAEVEARANGWKPLEEYDGDPKKWRTAEEFNEFGSRVTPLLKKQRDEFKSKFEEAERKYRGLSETVESLLKEARAKDRKEYEAQIKFLKEQKRQALSKGEHEVVAVLEDEIDELGKKPPPEYKPAAQQPQIPAHVQAALEEWKAENTWFETDPVLTRHATIIADELRRTGNKQEGMPFFRAVEQRIKEDFPEKFTKKRSAVEPASHSTARKSSGYESLDAFAKKQCDKFVNEDKFGTREEWLKIYNAAK